MEEKLNTLISKIMARKKYKKNLTKHHIIPISRGGSKLEDNISRIPRIQHQDYHTLFGNRTPEEIINYLVTNFWNKKREYVDKYYERYK